MARRRGYVNRIAVCAVLLAALMVAPGIGLCQDAKYPTKPIEVIVPYAPGGIVDLGARIVGDALSTELKVPVVVRNQAGGGGLNAPAAFLNVSPDGYTLLAGSTGAVITSVVLAKSPPFNPLKDFLPVGYVADSALALSVPKASPFKTIRDLVQYAIANPGKLKGGFSSVGSENHIMFNAFVRETKVEAKNIPYAGTPQLIAAILGGHVDWMTLTLPATLPYAKSGDVRILLLTKQSPELPGIPSGIDAGIKSFTSTIWIGILAHRNTPKPVYDRLVTAVKTISQAPGVPEKLRNAGFAVAYKNPPEFQRAMQEQWDNTVRVVKETGIKIN